jgi:AcrR family transcriptional regulator
MGNREDLLAGALECLKTKGWTRTTVRDIAAAAGVNHAAIGYHFGSREALLIEAFTQAIEAWGTETEGAVRASVAAGAGPREQYEAFWRQVIASYDANRWLWLATIAPALRSYRIRARSPGRALAEAPRADGGQPAAGPHRAGGRPARDS